MMTWRPMWAIVFLRLGSLMTSRRLQEAWVVRADSFLFRRHSMELWHICLHSPLKAPQSSVWVCLGYQFCSQTNRPVNPMRLAPEWHGVAPSEAATARGL